MAIMASASSGIPEQTIMPELVAGLCTKLAALGRGQRYMLGVTGYPGAGKSTVADALVRGVNEQVLGSPAMVVPMDGYHFPNAKLQDMKLLELKGIPDTFDADGFVDLLRRLRHNTGENVYCPLFERGVEASIENAIVIEPRHKLCIVEGNYLLLRKKPWDECKIYLDQVWFLDVTFDTILPRLLARHLQGGRTPEGARDKVDSTDLPNARLIEQTRAYADKLIRVD
jgi:pantothenate kinase